MKEELLVDSYYLFNFSGSNSTVPPQGRAFDNQSNSFTMNYAKIGLEVDADPVVVRADLGYGYIGQVLNGSMGPSFVVQQAYASLKVPTTPLTIDFGRFVTTAGAEVIEANKNWLYSRSLIFGIIPFFHTGVRLNLKVNDMLALQASIVNSQNSPDPDANSGKVIGLSAAVTPLPTTSIIATGYFGREGPQGNQGPEKITLDLVVAHNVSDAFGLNLNFDYVKLEPTQLTGAALMARFVASEHLTLAARGEFLSSKVTTPVSVTTNVFEGTLMAGFPFAGHLEIRAELRGDFSGDAIFNEGGTDPKKNQFTGTIAFLGFL